MNDQTRPPRRNPGEVLAPLELETLSHGALHLPGASLAHLQFRRFAGCPVCNLHLQTFASGQEQLRAAGVLTVAFFHSSAESMRPYQGSLPFPTVPDPTRRWYAHFGVERSAFAILHPRVVWSALRGLLSAPSNPLAGGGGQTGLPADFLLNRDGALVAVHYGRHADDQWSVDDVLALAAHR